MNKLFRQASLGLLLGGLLLTTHAHAQEFRIGFISTERVFKETNTAKAAQSKLEQEFSRREKELQDQGEIGRASCRERV